MGKTGNWIRKIFTGKKTEKEEKNSKSTSISSGNSSSSIQQTNNSKEKRRWSFRKSTEASTTNSSKDLNPMESIATTCLQEVQSMMESQEEQIKHTMTMTAATVAAADAVFRAAHDSSARINLCFDIKRPNSVQEVAAIKIQSVFRSYLAKKALRALKGLVKLQVLVRGYLVRKQATAALRCMQALVTVQARTRAQRILMAQENQSIQQKQSVHRKPVLLAHLQDNRVRQTYYDMEENIKIVEMDVGELKRCMSNRSTHSNHKPDDRPDHIFYTHSSAYHGNSNIDHLNQYSPVPSALTNLSPRTCSGYYEDYSLGLDHNSPHSSIHKPESPFVDYPFYPNYMTNTESFKAKVRSQSAPKQRRDSYERQLSKQRLSLEGKHIPRGVRMQRSSSHISSTTHGYRNPWSVKLDQSTGSLMNSECGSNSTVITNPNYCRSLVGYEVRQ